MSIFERISSIFDSPSRRYGVDYTQTISSEEITGVLLVFRRLCDQENIDIWLNEVGEDFMHLHHDFIPYWNAHLTDPESHPLNTFSEYLQSRKTDSVAFLDFLEVAFKNNEAPLDNDIILAINRELEDKDCPYRLTEFALVHQRHEHFVSITAERRPIVYLAHDSATAVYAIMPALALFHNSAFAAPAEAFQDALARQRKGDYRGSITSCAAAVESAIKIVAKRRLWSLRGTGVGSLAKSFIRAARLPSKLHEVAAVLAERRQNAGDAHGQEQVPDVREAEARFLVGLSASFIALVASEWKKDQIKYR